VGVGNIIDSQVWATAARCARQSSFSTFPTRVCPFWKTRGVWASHPEKLKAVLEQLHDRNDEEEK
jgi:hypothetical protein